MTTKPLPDHVSPGTASSNNGLLYTLNDGQRALVDSSDVEVFESIWYSWYGCLNSIPADTARRSLETSGMPLQVLGRLWELATSASFLDVSQQHAHRQGYLSSLEFYCILHQINQAYGVTVKALSQVMTSHLTAQQQSLAPDNPFAMASAFPPPCPIAISPPINDLLRPAKVLSTAPNPSTSYELPSSAVSVSKGSSIFARPANVEDQQDANPPFDFQGLCLVTESTSPSSSVPTSSLSNPTPFFPGLEVYERPSLSHNARKIDPERLGLEEVGGQGLAPNNRLVREYSPYVVGNQASTIPESGRTEHNGQRSQTWDPAWTVAHEAPLTEASHPEAFQEVQRRIALKVRPKANKRSSLNLGSIISKSRGKKQLEAKEEKQTGLLINVLEDVAREGNLELVRVALKLGADPQWRTGKRENKALELAADGGHTDVVDYLLRQGATFRFNGPPTPVSNNNLPRVTASFGPLEYALLSSLERGHVDLAAKLIMTHHADPHTHTWSAVEGKIQDGRTEYSTRSVVAKLGVLQDQTRAMRLLKELRDSGKLSPRQTVYITVYNTIKSMTVIGARFARKPVFDLPTAFTALACFARYGRIEALGILLQDNRFAENVDASVLYHAIVGDSLDCSLALVYSWPQVLYSEFKVPGVESEIYSSVGLALHHRRWKIAQALIKHGFDFSVAAKETTTADTIIKTSYLVLTVDSEENPPDTILKLLLQKDPPRTIDTCSALHKAFTYRHAQATDILLAHYASELQTKSLKPMMDPPQVNILHLLSDTECPTEMDDRQRRYLQIIDSVIAFCQQFDVKIPPEDLLRDVIVNVNPTVLRKLLDANMLDRATFKKTLVSGMEPLELLQSCSEGGILKNSDKNCYSRLSEALEP